MFATVSDRGPRRHVVAPLVSHCSERGDGKLRRRGAGTDATRPFLRRSDMRVRLTRKYAERIDGIDLSRCRVGDVLDLPDRDARVLIAEGWAAPLDDEADRAVRQRAKAADARGLPRRRRRT